MNQWRIVAGSGLLLGLLLAVGCDSRPSGPRMIAQNGPTSSPDSDRPTTQQLLEGPFKKYPLPDMPLSIRAPESWKFSSAAHMQFLEGPTPQNQAVLQFAKREPIPDDRIEALIARLKEEGADTSAIARAEMHQVGAMRILERVFTSKPLTTPKLDLDGRPVLDVQGKPEMMSTTPVHWSISAFVPEGNTWNHFELNVIGLSTDQYEIDKPFLEKILNSLAYESGINVIP